MATIMMQRDLVVTLKKETAANIAILSKVQPMPAELSRLVFKDNALEKPTQRLFNHLSYYLLSIIDANICASFTWPLYDTKGERAFRNKLASFISDYSSKGLLSPVMSSYLINPGCFKVTKLTFQLSQLAVKRMLITKMKKPSQKKLFSEMTDKYKSQQRDGFVECIEEETKRMRSKFSNYLYKRRTLENIARMLRKKIADMERKLSTTGAQNYIDNIVDGFLKLHDLDEDTKLEFCKIKNVTEQSKIFDICLTNLDRCMDSLETCWDRKASSLLVSSQRLRQYTETLVARHTGECDPSAYTVEYNHETDAICTTDLEDQVNAEQKYVLRNLVKDERLNFPNLIRVFVISICFVLKHNEIGNEIYVFNEYLDCHRQSYSEMVSTMKVLIERIHNAEMRLEPTNVLYCSEYANDLPKIPPLPDLSSLKATRDPGQVLFDKFTPLNLSKFHFNLQRRADAKLFAMPHPKALITPFHPVPRDDFLKSAMSCRIRSYDRQMSDNHNISVISNSNKGNETIAVCSSGFTKHQIRRLLSTKKTSSSKKFKYASERPNINIKKGGLFHESMTSNDSNGLFRSYSSPNLLENREKRFHSKGRGRNLSIMQEDSPSSLLEMSGIAALGRNINHSTPQDIGSAESSRKLMDTSMVPAITVTSDKEGRINHILDNELDFDKEMGNSIVSPILDEQRKSVELIEVSQAKNVTPEVNSRIKKTTSSSLEKIINRFKKVRESVVSYKGVSTEFKTIDEGRETGKSVNFNVVKANRLLLPDLLSPSCNNVLDVSNNHIDDFDESCLGVNKVDCKRLSLGTALGVDETFLDQFDVID